MPNQATATARALQPELVGRLAKFFPQATPVRIPVKLSRAEGTDRDIERSDTVIEFGTPCEVLFATDRPLEFADRVLARKQGRLSAGRSFGRGCSISPEPDGRCRPVPKKCSQLDREIMTPSASNIRRASSGRSSVRCSRSIPRW